MLIHAESCWRLECVARCFQPWVMTAIWVLSRRLRAQMARKEEVDCKTNSTPTSTVKKGIPDAEYNVLDYILFWFKRLFLLVPIDGIELSVNVHQIFTLQLYHMHGSRKISLVSTCVRIFSSQSNTIKITWNISPLPVSSLTLFHIPGQNPVSSCI